MTPGEDDIDRQLKQLSSTSEVDSELAKMKAELGQGGEAPKGELGSGEGSGSTAAGSDSAPEGVGTVGEGGGASQEQAQ